MESKMATGFMILEVELPDGGAVTLEGSNAKYWKGCGLPDYEGAIDGLPAQVLTQLVKAGAIKRVD
jgi:hypothetical protein